MSAADQESVAHIGGAALFCPFIFVVCFAAVGWCSAEPAASIADDHRPVLVGREDPYGPAHCEWDESVGEDEVDVAVTYDPPDCVGGHWEPCLGVGAAGRVAKDCVHICDDPDMRSVAMFGLRVEVGLEDLDDRVSTL